MLRYVLRRVVWGAVMLVVVSALTFVIFTILPSADPAALRAGRQATPELIAQIRQNLGLDKPVYVQYWRFLKGLVLHFDLGYSYQNSVSVKSQVFTRLPVTLSLTAGGVRDLDARGDPDRRDLGDPPALGRSTARRWAARSSRSRRPSTSSGSIALFLFSNDIGVVHVLPGAGTYTPITVSPWRWLTSLLMPWCVLAAGFAAFYARMVRGNLIDTMGEDYIRTARAKGLSERRVIARHGLGAALTPVVTMAGLDIGILLGGAILTETVFNIPGIGRYAYDSIINSDLPAIEGTVLFGAFFIIAANIFVDIVYAFLDPRVRY